jgi:hypothetical protein
MVCNLYNIPFYLSAFLRAGAERGQRGWRPPSPQAARLLLHHPARPRPRGLRRPLGGGGAGARVGAVPGRRRQVEEAGRKAGAATPCRSRRSPQLEPVGRLPGARSLSRRLSLDVPLSLLDPPPPPPPTTTVFLTSCLQNNQSPFPLIAAPLLTPMPSTNHLPLYSMFLLYELKIQDPTQTPFYSVLCLLFSRHSL